MPLVMRPAPTVSKSRSGGALGRSASMSRNDAARMTATTGRLTKKTHRQLASVVSTPPKTTPAAPDRAPTPPQAPSALTRSPRV